ncbi:MAG TPA: hypothetical protein VGO37_21445 [Steroidobacteraceae bacterium]|jgi:hypothetical protein|nr:hypothetical protein [Steroidobacteraceae bacterium]
MKGPWVKRLCCAIGLSLLRTHAAQAAQAAHDNFEVRAYVDDACIVADEPYFLPATGNKDAPDQSTAKFLPLLGLVVGKLAELFINHAIQASADRIKSNAVRKDTRYAVTRQMNLYRVDFQPGPVLGINAKLGCMTIVAASFKPEPADCTAEYVPKELSSEARNLPQNEWTTSRTDDSIENQLRRANACVNGKAKAVYEARFEFSKDATAFRLKDAGYRIESLLTTPEKAAVRTTVYTLKISNPGATDQQEVLSSAWVNIGTVSPGSHANGAKSDAAPWLRVPPLSIEARRVYEEKTKVHQEVMGEIGALTRAQVRNRRMLAGLDQRIASANAETADGLKQERTRIAIQTETLGAELDARKAEYQDLPRASLEFMPVTIEVAVTETESERKAQLALAEIIGKNSGLVGAAVASTATGLISKSVASSDIKTESDSSDAATELETARIHYFDALVEVQSNANGGAGAESRRNLEIMKDKYNEARRAQGLERIK